MNKVAPKSFLQGLAELAEGLRRKIEAGVSGFSDDPAASAQRRRQAETDFRFFAKTYFPHYVSSSESVLHSWLYERLPRLVDHRQGSRLALAAPRGEAKSTLISRIFTLWCVITGKRKYAVIVADSYGQAAVMLETIKAELEANPRLLTDYPKEAGQGPLWREGVIVTANNAKVQAFGSGTRLRGLSHGPHRPDLVVLDDMENDENVVSPAQRDKLERWLDRSVLSLGPPDGSLAVVLVGTILHYDSVLSRKLKSPFWEGKVFRAILRWPDRMDLWDQWEALLLNFGAAAAEVLWRRHQPEMERGAEVSWPPVRPLVALMAKRAADGHAAFDSEMQNDPASGEDNPFSGGVIRFWTEPDPEWIFYGACDPSLGLKGASRDPCAILVGGLNRRTGVLSVVEAKIVRMVPDRIIEEIIAAQARFRCVLWAVEAVQFQMMMVTELVKRSAARGIPVPARPVQPYADKLLRIESLQPHVANGLILLHASQSTLLEQFRHFPLADHDDGPDATEMLWQAAQGGRVPMEFQAFGHRPVYDAPLTVSDSGWGAVGERFDMTGYQ
ncbi:MAG: phage terminase large subunit [Magnetococcales bacterium]|nr:phage terminase large subunit [Magnetococcales bacterium]